MAQSTEITACLLELRRGRSGAFDRLVALVYEDLRRLARIQLRRPGSPLTLNPTALVHEAYVKLADRTRLEYADRDHFLAACSVVMRNIVIDLARARRARKRGGDQVRVDVDPDVIRVDQEADRLLALDEAMRRLADLEPRLVRVVECRFFAGLTEAETARALDVSERTVRRDWVKGKGLLQVMLDGGGASGGAPGAAPGGPA